MKRTLEYHPPTKSSAAALSQLRRVEARLASEEAILRQRVAASAWNFRHKLKRHAVKSTLDLMEAVQKEVKQWKESETKKLKEYYYNAVSAALYYVIKEVNDEKATHLIAEVESKIRSLLPFSKALLYVSEMQHSEIQEAFPDLTIKIKSNLKNGDMLIETADGQLVYSWQDHLKQILAKMCSHG
jgi:hypothetical protein